jgi:hypothetical protein
VKPGDLLFTVVEPGYPIHLHCKLCGHCCRSYVCVSVHGRKHVRYKDAIESLTTRSVQRFFLTAQGATRDEQGGHPLTS